MCNQAFVCLTISLQGRIRYSSLLPNKYAHIRATVPMLGPLLLNGFFVDHRLYSQLPRVRPYLHRDRFFSTDTEKKKKTTQKAYTLVGVRLSISDISD